jgi:hypothetical protein
MSSFFDVLPSLIKGRCTMAAEDERDAAGRFEGAPARRPPGGSGRGVGRRTTAFKHFKIDALLTSADERAAYDALIADPNSTVRSLRAWLAARGHVVSSNAVSNHRLSRHLELRTIREATAQAAAYCEVSRRHGAGAVAEASHAKFELMLMQRLFGRPDAPQMPPAEWHALAKVVGHVLDNRRSVEGLRGEIAKCEAAAATQGGGRRRTFAEAVRRTRQILGLEEPDPNDWPDVPPKEDNHSENN